MTPAFWIGLTLITPAVALCLASFARWVLRDPKAAVKALRGAGIGLVIIATFAGIIFGIAGIWESNQPRCGTPEGDKAYSDAAAEGRPGFCRINGGE